MPVDRPNKHALDAHALHLFGYLFSIENHLVDLAGESRDLIEWATESAQADARFLHFTVSEDKHPLVALAGDLKFPNVSEQTEQNKSNRDKNCPRYQRVVNQFVLDIFVHIF